jgi:hypothetical protein
MSTCINCNKQTTQICNGCKCTYYCSRDCQVKHWKNHKIECDNLSTNNLLNKICQILLMGEELEFYSFDYFCKRMIGKDLYWFFKYNDFLIKGNIEDYYTKRSSINMTREEFANYYYTGKCSIFNFGVAFGLFNLLLSKKSIKLYGNKIIKLYILKLDIFKPYITNILSFEYPIPDNDKNHNNWDCDRMHSNKHQVIGVKLDNNCEYLLDFAAAQYGIYTQTSEHNWLHIEKIVDDNRCSYGFIDDVIPIDQNLIKKIELDTTDKRSILIKKIDNLICNIK